MKVVFKFAIAFFVASVVCLVAFTYVLAIRESARVERGFAAGMTSFGTGLAKTVETAFRDGGYESAERVVRGFDPDGEIRVRLARDTEEVREPGAVALEHDELRHTLRVLIRVQGSGGESAILTLERPLVEGRSILRAELGDELLAAAGLAAVMAILAVLLGGILIGGPLDGIVAQARRIGEGDLSQRLRATRNDEIGVLELELNATCDRLALANTRIEEETSARIETLEKLRHLDRLRTVGTIASGIAHELGTPLNILLLRGNSLAKDTMDPRDVREAGEVVVEQVEKMSRIVRHLLDFARGRRTAATRASQVDLVEVARHASALLASVAKKAGVAIVVEEREPVTTRGDFRQIEQAVTNLIVNGIQAMRKGGRLTLRVGSARDADMVAIDVIDEGEGMSDEVRERVFEPFFTTKSDAEGTGLGLHVARGIAEDHGGTIEAASEPGRGSTFALVLPRSTS